MKKIIPLLSLVIFISLSFFAGSTFSALDDSNNIQSDPFGAPPIGISPNCGPEERYKFDIAINSKNDFVNFIKNNKISVWVELVNFKDGPQAEINWGKVLNAIEIEKVNKRLVYSLNYNPHPGECAGFTLKITNDGYVSVYGCCGK